MIFLTKPIMYGMAGLLLLAGLWISYQSLRTAKLETKVAEAATALVEARDALRGCATSLNAVNAQTELAQQEAAQQARRAEDAEQRAEKSRKAYTAAQTRIEVDIERAKRNPDCRRMLEQNVCATLR